MAMGFSPVSRLFSVCLSLLLIGGCGAPEPHVTAKDQGNSGSASAYASQDPLAATKVPANRYLIVDQFGYRPQDLKQCIIADPQRGYNEDESFTPGNVYELRRWDTDSLVKRGAAELWKQGAVDIASGDRGWIFDFSEVQQTGTYYVIDVENKVRSFPFRIDEAVYDQVLIAACRMFFYNRANVDRHPPYADERWQDDACHVGPGQDRQAHALWDRRNETLFRDVRGAWYDAGDPNKYVTFLPEVIHSLLTSWRRHPKLWQRLSFNVPESSNELPDLVDEICIGLDWLVRMQDPDGGVYNKVGMLDYKDVSPPSYDFRPRYYGPKTTSAAIVTASMFAHAAYAFANIPALKDYRTDLIKRAEKAWGYYQRRHHERDIDVDKLDIKSGDADRDLFRQDQDAVAAAIYLYAVTEKPEYKKWVEQKYQVLQPWHDIRWGMWENYQGSAIMDYVALPGISPQVKDAILSKRLGEVNWVDIYQFRPDEHLYQAPNPVYTWGSNRTICDVGQTVMELVHHGLVPERHQEFINRSAHILHYIHGVNPQNLVYLSNMSDYGAEHSVHKMYHTWFAKDTPWSDSRTGPGPAPGYLVGGPNPHPQEKLPIPGYDQLVDQQPPQKAYADENEGFGIWAVTEPAIYYQAAYIELLADFVAR